MCRLNWAAKTLGGTARRDCSKARYASASGWRSSRSPSSLGSNELRCGVRSARQPSLHRARWPLVVRISLDRGAFRLLRCPLHEAAKQLAHSSATLWRQEHHQGSTTGKGGQNRKSVPRRRARDARATKGRLHRRLRCCCQCGTKDAFCFYDERVHAAVPVHHACHRATARATGVGSPRDTGRFAPRLAQLCGHWAKEENCRNPALVANPPPARLLVLHDSIVTRAAFCSGRID